MTASSYKPTAKEEEFVKYHERIRDELNTAKWHFEIWKYLRNLIEDYHFELNQAPAFFGLTIRSHLFETVMRLNRLFDRGGDIVSIYEFLDFVEQNLDVFSNEAFEKRMRGKETFEISMREHVEIAPQKVEWDRQRIETLPLPNLRTWRNKALAHIDKKHVLEDIDVFERYPVKVEQIDEIIDTVHDVLNDYCCAYDDSTWSSHLPLTNGIQYVVDSIRFRIEEERKRWGLKGEG